ncbi:MAG: ABC transporter permease [Candidatus Aminicenantes bacterium]|jgi:putative ABC transport system permease protein
MSDPRKKPPKVAKWLLLRFANRDERAAIIGDFEEEFYDRVDSAGFFRAHLWYWKLALISFPSFTANICYWSGAMFKNYLTVALRNVRRHKAFSSINIAGLAVGMAASILIAVFVLHELSFDRHHEKADRIYRVVTQFDPSGEKRGGYTVPPMAQAMLDDLSEVEHAARLSLWPRNYLVRYEDKLFLEKGIIFADASIFDVFTIPFLLGDPKSALIDPRTVVITEDIAHKYFGNENPLGKSLRFEDQDRDFKITGVVNNCPATSHFQYEMIGSLVTSPTAFETGWGGHTYFTYISLSDKYARSQLEAKLPDFCRRHWGAYHYAETGQTYDEYMKSGKEYYGFSLEPLLDIHLNSGVVDYLSVKGNKTYVYVFSVIAIFILLIACINFMNLSTARFAHRSKEVGVRKVLGSNQKQLVWQFLGESVLLSLFALVFAVLLVKLVLPTFRNLASRQLELGLFQSVSIVPFLVGFAILVGILAGCYPAFFLASIQPARTVKGSRGQRSKGNIFLRRALVVLQFAATFGIFFGTYVISYQLQYVRNKELGFNKEHVVVIHRADALGKKGEAFKQELMRYPNVITISDTESLPGRHFNPNSHRLEGRPATETPTLHTMYGDHKFVELLDLEIVAGRYFSPDILTDATSSVVINERAIKELGLTDALGKRLHKEFGGAKPGEFVTIIGVLEDFHFNSLHYEILPMIIRPLSVRTWNFTSVRIGPANIPQTLSRIEDTWNTMTGGQPFEYSFLDEDFDNLYRNEQRMGQIFSLFAGLAIFIACLGLVGLVSFTAEQRTKEIGIRKVLGASVTKIVYLLSREVIVLVSVASLVAAPMAYYGMHRWLENFAFRIGISPLMFVLTAIGTLAIALFSVSFRAIKAAQANPIDSIRYE